MGSARVGHGASALGSGLCSAEESVCWGQPGAGAHQPRTWLGNTAAGLSARSGRGHILYEGPQGSLGCRFGPPVPHLFLDGGVGPGLAPGLRVLSVVICIKPFLELPVVLFPHH